MKSKTLTLILLLATILTIAFFVTNKRIGSLVGPEFIQQITHSQYKSVSTPAPTPNAPKTFKFDSSTNLKDELDKVNPQVLDSDFE